MPCTDVAIGRFEKQNPIISVNVFGAEDNVIYYEIYPLRNSETQGRKNEIDLSTKGFVYFLGAPTAPHNTTCSATAKEHQTKKSQNIPCAQ